MMILVNLKNLLFFPTLLITQKFSPIWSRKVTAKPHYQNHYLSIKSIKTLFMMVFLSLLLASCGGGGGDSGDEKGTAKDTTPPVIKIDGDNSVNINQGSSYIDSGATATDNVDGSVNIQTIGTVDTMVSGSYSITYSATDAAGNTVSATRTIVVNPTYEISVIVSGLDGEAIEMKLNSSENIVIAQSGQFEFLTKLPKDDSYQIAVVDGGYLCTPDEVSSTITSDTANIIQVDCVKARVVNFNIEESIGTAVAPTTLLTSNYEADINDTSSSGIKILSKNSLAVALDENEQLLYMSMIGGDETSIGMGPRSTALSFILLHPAFASYISSQQTYPKAFVDKLYELNEVELLANMLNEKLTNGGDWTEFDDPAIILATENAIKKAFEYLEVELLNVSLSSKAQSIKGTARKVQPVIVGDNPFKSGVYVLAEADLEKDVEPRIDLIVQNSFQRWIQVIGSDYEIDDLIAPNSEKSYVINGEELQYQDLIIDVFGAGKTNNVADGDWDKAIKPIAMTLILDTAVPIVSTMTGANLCIKQFFKPKDPFVTNLVNNFSEI